MTLPSTWETSSVPQAPSPTMHTATAEVLLPASPVASLALQSSLGTTPTRGWLGSGTRSPQAAGSAGAILAGSSSSTTTFQPTSRRKGFAYKFPTSLLSHLSRQGFFLLPPTIIGEGISEPLAYTIAKHN